MASKRLERLLTGRIPETHDPVLSRRRKKASAGVEGHGPHLIPLSFEGVALAGDEAPDAYRSVRARRCQTLVRRGEGQAGDGVAVADQFLFSLGREIPNDDRVL